MNTKKIAYIFHGHSRTWDQCHENFFKNVYSVLPGDIFIHTWDRVNALSPSYWNPNGSYASFTAEQNEISNRLADVQGIHRAYKPAIMIVEQDRAPDYTPLQGTQHIETQATPAALGTKSMLYQSRMIFQLAEAYGDYDHYFSTRLDINHPEKMTEQEAADLLSADAISVVPSKNVSDLWMFGPRHLMDIKTDYFSHIDDYWFKRHPNLLGYGYEMALTDYLRDNNVTIRWSDFPWEIRRVFQNCVC